MYPLVETIALRDGKIPLLEYHQRRYEQASTTLFPQAKLCNLTDILSTYQEEYPLGLYKIRFLYDTSSWSIEIEPYVIRAVKSLKIIFNDTIEYAYKSTNRTLLTTLFNQRNECDNILLIKNNMVTDTAYSNILFYDGTSWITPSNPLLYGVQRQALLDKQIIIERPILVDELSHYKKARMINGLITFEDKCDILIEDIHE